MNREEMTLLGFEIVAYAGDARSKLLEALKAAENGDFAKADSLVVEAGSCIAEAHNSQTAMWNGNSFFDKFYKVQNFFPYAIPIVLDNEPPRM